MQMKLKNRLHELEIIQLMKQAETTYTLTPRQSLDLIAHALSLSPGQKEQLVSFITYPNTLRAFEDVTLHIYYYIQANVGIDRIRRFTHTTQPRVYKVIKGEDVPTIYTTNLNELLQDPTVLTNLYRLTSTLKPMNGVHLPQFLYTPQPEEETNDE